MSINGNKKRVFYPFFLLSGVLVVDVILASKKG